MKRIALFITLAIASLSSAFAQTTTSAAPGAKPDKAAAYYNFSMGHLYAELAQAYNNRGEYLNKAIEHYRAAIKADPKFATAHYYLGMSLSLEKKSRVSAMASLEKAAKLGEGTEIGTKAKEKLKEMAKQKP